MSEGMADIPEESNVNTESDGVGLGEYENYSYGDHDKEDYSDRDHNKDEDYVDSTQVPNQPEFKKEQEEVFKAAHKQKKKGAFKFEFTDDQTIDKLVSGNPTWIFL